MSNSLLVQLSFKGCSSPICLLLFPLQRPQMWLLGFKAMFSRKERVEYVCSILPVAGARLSTSKDCITLGPDF